MGKHDREIGLFVREKRYLKDKKLFYYTISYFIFCWPFLIQNYNLSISLFCLVGISLSFFIKQKNIEIRMGLKTLFVLSSVAFFYGQFGTFRGLEPGIALLSIMAMAKSLELKTKRDYCIFLLIVELIVMGNMLIVESLLYIVFIIASTFVLFYLLLLINCEQTTELTWELKKNYIRMFLASLLMSIPLFFVFPRLDITFFNISKVVENPVTGFTKELRPGDIAKLYESNLNVFSAVFEKETPPQEALYWRGEVLGVTDGINWTRQKADRKHTHHLDDKSVTTYTVLFEEQGTGHLFNLENVRSLKPISRFHYVETSQGIFKAFPLSKRPFSYRGIVAEREDISRPKSLNRYLQIPINPSPRMKKLREELTFDNDTRETTIKRIGDFLKTNEFVYTYEPGIYKRGQFLDEFFFERKKGFCGHFASATAILMRLLGIPSRVIIGFQGGTPGHFKDFLVKARDAHSWIEYWNDEKGWTRFDPTLFVAPERIRMNSLEYIFQESKKRQSESPLMRAVRRMAFQVESLYYSINTYFLNYDLDAQKDFFKKVFNLKVDRNILLVGVFFILAVFLTLYFVSLERAKIPYDAYKKIYLKVLKKLKRKGVCIRSSDGPEDVLSNARSILDRDSFKNLKNILGYYMKFRYGEEDLSQGRDRLAKLVKNSLPFLKRRESKKTV